MHDSRVLKNYSLFHEAEESNILSNPTDVIEKTKVVPKSKSFRRWETPLNKWSIKPDTFLPALSPQEKKFNKALSSARVIAERAFSNYNGDIKPTGFTFNCTWNSRVKN